MPDFSQSLEFHSNYSQPTAMSTPSQQPWSLASKAAIVTGGSRGIGRAIAIHPARKGLEKLAITYASNSAAAQVTLEECHRLGVGQTVAIQADVLDPQFGPVVVDQALQGLGTSTIDILVNNAVITDPSIAQSFADTTIDVFTKVMQGNVFAAMSITNAVLPHLPEHGGRVINISSMSAKAGNPDPIITYGASKAALDSVTRSLAKTFALSKRATFTSVTVGLTETDAYAMAKQNFPPEVLEAQIQEFTAAKRIGTPEDVAYVVGFLASEEARWVNGACISANGGLKELLAVHG
ncbi:short-chain dehydrogenase reductase sdr [Fusarium albosuccineum]|uniref:Short-chain dehydrogenase reductase sdr n=1 Tax=Fusarium albosuccineum TaxID=1237068 RepID=A0A8H4PAN9_9HYPO|nr:short-chain dehydrogenase reductase sdr [Fusarium albosuccineum]